MESACSASFVQLCEVDVQRLFVQHGYANACVSCDVWYSDATFCVENRIDSVGSQLSTMFC